MTVDRAIRRLGDKLVRQVLDGAALLAICGGYQNLSRSYRASTGPVVRGPGLFRPAPRWAKVDSSGRSSGILRAHSGSPLRAVVPPWSGSRTTPVGPTSSRAPCHSQPLKSGVGTTAGTGPRVCSSCRIRLAPRPEDFGSARTSTVRFCHATPTSRMPSSGPAWPARGQTTDLAALDDSEEWRAHDRFVERCRRRPWIDRLPTRLRRVLAPGRNLIGF